MDEINNNLEWFVIGLWCLVIAGVVFLAILYAASKKIPRE